MIPGRDPAPRHPISRSSPPTAAVSLALLRPHLLVPAWAAAATGVAVLPAGTAAPLETRAIVAGLGWSAVLAAGHVLNLWRDRQVDLLNRKNRFWRGRIGADRLPAIAAVLAAGGIGLGLARPAALPPLIASLLLVLAYNLPPLDLSRRWGADVMAHLVGFALVAPWLGQSLVAKTIGAELGPATIYLAGPVTAGFLWSTMLDAEGDRRAGKTTWAVRWGQSATARAAVIVACLVPALAWAWLGWIALPGAVLLIAAASGPLLRPPCRSGGRRLTRTAVGLAVIAAALPVVLRWPAAGLGLALLGGVAVVGVEWTEGQATP